jgi:glycogen debranching enzyme
LVSLYIPATVRASHPAAMTSFDTKLTRLRPRPRVDHISHDRTVLAVGSDGFIRGSRQGLFVDETRLLSHYRCEVDGRPLFPIALSNVEQRSWLGYYIASAPGTGGARASILGPTQAAQQTLEVRVTRVVRGGVHEDIDLTNFTQREVSVQLTFQVAADFADQQETSTQRQQHGTQTCHWHALEHAWELTFDYRAEHHYDHQGHRGVASLHRGLTLRIEKATSPAAFEAGRIRFEITLAPQAQWHACLKWTPMMEGRSLTPYEACYCFNGDAEVRDRRDRFFLDEATAFAVPGGATLQQTVVAAIEQGKRDLLALRLHEFDAGERAWTVAAGLPLYVALFGRDMLTAAWEAALLGPELMLGTLAELARWQGTKFDDWRDEQPGRMLHEAHPGPLAALHYNPKGRDYCSVTAANFYPFVLAQLWHWTGSKEAVAPYLDPAVRALQWLNTADLDGDGFVEYQTRSTQGLRNQSWKDSDDALVHEDGRQAPTPIATCEEQGIAHAAKLNLAEVLWWFDRKDEAQKLYHEAMEVKKRFNEAYWMADLGCFAMALDGRKRPMRSIGSNPIHCVAAGIAEQELGVRTLERMFAADMFSGWGVRTLSSEHPAYDPYSYHRGSVWPVEHGPLAVALYRYGQHTRMHEVCQAQFELASLFEHTRLPECVSGHQRDAEHPFPALYPDANSPQAWSATTPLTLLQVMLGLQPFAPLNLLFIDPRLPAWLPEITLNRLRVGQAVVSMRFFRTPNGRSDYEICEQRGALHIVRQPSPWSLTATVPERLRDLLESFLPTR